MGAITEKPPFIREKVGKFHEFDVFDVKEFEFFFCKPPERALCATQVNGLKKSKPRIICLACSNFLGSEKYPLMIIGHARRLRQF